VLLTYDPLIIYFFVPALLSYRLYFRFFPLSVIRFPLGVWAPLWDFILSFICFRYCTESVGLRTKYLGSLLISTAGLNDPKEFIMIRLFVDIFFIH
jgi:hypothetical protein